jgi:hypothetical protein
MNLYGVYIYIAMMNLFELVVLIFSCYTFVLDLENAS